MLRKIAAAAIAALVCAPALARDVSVDHGRNESRNVRHGRHSRTGAWIDDNRRHSGSHHHGAHWVGGHGHFSPRGQGGHHWGW
ncbi:hypothetical protein WOC76_07405 [Methylocystis sp. IM3]|jgi:hypothetical protein|uniref:hypothetical protein n=1 Tax=unclassified Methylocystis TaxID=2625913 RepID=UPI000FB587C6|nr:MAG: hypothetical protein EKK29_12350 [Hyphomicrobiales bacterium]